MDLNKYVTYIRNTGRVPLSAAMFDDDWEPVGPTLRHKLAEAGLVTEGPDGLRIVERSNPETK